MKEGWVGGLVGAALQGRIYVWVLLPVTLYGFPTSNLIDCDTSATR
jgi:hypothetical protein